MPTLSDEIERILALLPKSSAAGSGPWAYAQHLAEGLAGTDFQRIILGLREQGHEIADAAVDFVLALSRVEPVSEWTLRFLNRLSDLFFVLGRWVGKQTGEREYLWERGLSAHARRRGETAGG